MFKNVASQKAIVFAFDSTTNLPKTGDAANLTSYVSKDFGTVTVLGDTSATEMDATNAKGYYLFDLTQAETNANTLLFSAKSSTANIVVIAVPATVFTSPVNFSALTIASGGAVTAGTVSDKTGYALTQTFPTNFSALGISSGGKINEVVLCDTLTTYTGNIVQTGDSFARLGLAGAGLTNLGDSRIVNLDAAISTRTKPADTQARVTLVDTVTTYTGNTVQTGDAFARVGLAGVGLTNLGDTRIAHLNADISSRASEANATTNVNTIIAHGDTTWTSTNSGAGPCAYIITVTDTDAVALEGASIRLTEGVNVLSGVTNAPGHVTFGTQARTYQCVVAKDGYSGSVSTLVISGDGATTIQLTPVNIAPSTGDADTVTAYIVLADAILSYQQLTAGTGGTFEDDVMTTTSDINGLASFVAVRGATYRYWVNNGMFKSVTIAADAPDPLPLSPVAA